jgi:integral membrane protein
MMLTLFRTVAILEGISYLLLFAVGMPLKYWGEIPEPNIYIGYTHGFLFLAYVVLAVLLTMEGLWGYKKFLWIFIASLLPFGTFYLDEYYLKKLSRRN